MNDGWRVIMTVVMVCLLLGAVAIGVGFVTGGSMDRIETGLETQYHISTLTETYRNYIPELVSQYLWPLNP